MKLQGDERLPDLEFDEDIGQIKISGRSVSIACNKFWIPLNSRMQEYLIDPRDISLTIDLEYFNTPSAKRLLDLLKLIEMRCKETSRHFTVTWIYDCEDMQEAGENFESISDDITLWRFRDKEQP